MYGLLNGNQHLYSRCGIQSHSLYLINHGLQGEKKTAPHMYGVSYCIASASTCLLCTSFSEKRDACDATMADEAMGAVCATVRCFRLTSSAGSVYGYLRSTGLKKYLSSMTVNKNGM